jgi:RNA polymerase sigma-70 factor, ECF subfamily
MKKRENYSLEVQKLKFEEKTGVDFNKFYKKYLPKLNYYLTSYCKDTDLADDISAESFLKALDEIDKYDNTKSQFSTWLFTIARNITLQKMKEVNRFSSIDRQIDDEGSTIKDFIGETDNEDKEKNEFDQLNWEKGQIVLKAIDNLKTPYKTVLEMRELKNMSYKKIAADLGSDEVFELVSDGSVTDLPFEINNIYEILNKKGETPSYTLIEGDKIKSPFYTKILLDKGIYTLVVRKPQNLSTTKSQIKCARTMVQTMVRKDFENLEKNYL